MSYITGGSYSYNGYVTIPNGMEVPCLPVFAASEPRLALFLKEEGQLGLPEDHRPLRDLLDASGGRGHQIPGAYGEQEPKRLRGRPCHALLR